jgi:SpoVK/Ycf46/Vps4 family AAA+-type ATPase
MGNGRLNQQQPVIRKTLGGKRRLGSSKRPHEDADIVNEVTKRVFPQRGSNNQNQGPTGNDSEEVDERLKNIDPKMVEAMESLILADNNKIQWDDIAGLDHAKQSIKEMVIWPMKRPDLFTGIRRSSNGILLFGPPGTGKTMVSSMFDATFYNVCRSVNVLPQPQVVHSSMSARQQ